MGRLRVLWVARVRSDSVEESRAVLEGRRFRSGDFPTHHANRPNVGGHLDRPWSSSPRGSRHRGLPRRFETLDQYLLPQAVLATAESHPSTPREPDRSHPAPHSSTRCGDWRRFQDLLPPPERGPLANVPPMLGRLAWLPVSSSRATARWCWRPGSWLRRT